MGRLHYFIFSATIPFMIVRSQARLVVLLELALALAICRPVPAADERPAAAYFRLDNGLQVLLQERRGLPLTGMALTIDLGFKDENDATSGYAHLLEHMLLFGAGAAGDGEARLAELRGRGVETNAHTDHDLMTFEVSCPSAESAWALEQMRQTVFFASLDPVRLEEEKRIIGEEFLQRRDDPDYLGRILLMERLFAGHPYGRPLLDKDGALGAATVEGLRAFCAPRLVADRCALAIIGDFALVEMETEVRRNWGALPRGAAPAAEVPAVRRLEKSSEQHLERDLQESHLFIGWQAPAYNDEQRLAFSLLTHLLGGGLNPVLSSVLRDGRRLVDRIHMSYSPMRSGGMAVLHLVLEKRNMDSALSELASFLSNIGSFNFSRQDVLPQFRQGMLDHLESAKNQIEYSDGNFRESALNLSLAAARFLLLNRTAVTGSYLESVEKVSSSDLRRAAARYLSGKKWVVLAITPPPGKKK